MGGYAYSLTFGRLKEETAKETGMARGGLLDE